MKIVINLGLHTGCIGSIFITGIPGGLVPVPSDGTRTAGFKTGELAKTASQVTPQTTCIVIDRV